MKKIVSIFLILSMLFGITACGSKYNAQDVIDLINNIGEVTSKSGEAIEKAQKAYDSLSLEDQKKVSNHVALLQAHTKYDGLIFYLEVEELKASGKEEEAEAKIQAAKDNGDQNYHEYLRMIDTQMAEGDSDTTSKQQGAAFFEQGSNSQVASKQQGQDSKNEAINQSFFDTSTAKKSPVAFKSNVDGEIYKELAKAFGLAEDISLIPYPTTDGEYTNNFFYLYMRGEWEYYNGRLIDANPDWVLYDNFAFTSAFHCYIEEVVNPCTIFAKNGKFYVTTENQKPALSQKDICDRQKAAYEEALNIQKAFREDGKIKEGMSQYEIAKAYADSLYDYVYNDTPRVFLKDFRESLSANNYTGPYTVLINKTGNCGPHEGVYSLLMHLEGIPCYGIHVAHVVPQEEKVQSHAMSLVNADGTEYFVDWGNRVGILNAQSSIKNKKYVSSEYDFLLPRLLIKYKGSIVNATNGYYAKVKDYLIPLKIELVLSANQTYKLWVDSNFPDDGDAYSPVVGNRTTRQYFNERASYLYEYKSGVTFNIGSDLLKKLGITEGQGFIMLRPMYGNNYLKALP